MDSHYSKLATNNNSTGRKMMPPPPLNIQSSVTRVRSSTMTSLDSTLTSTSSFSNSTVTPIRPQPVHASSYSLDSGFEVSPLYLRSFRYGESASFPVDITPPGNETVGMGDDSNEGLDQELISIDHHFTPISAPSGGAGSSTTASTYSAFPFSADLVNERRINRMNRQMAEVNNNDPSFPNLNGSHVAADYLMLDLFPLEVGDDDVFYHEDDEEEMSEPGDDLYERESRSWHIPRPSCIVSESEPDLAQSELQYNRNVLLSEESVTSSRRSSTPIPIPGSASGSENGFDLFDGDKSFFHPSVPEPLTRMPFFHHMAPPLNRRDPLNGHESNDDDGIQQRITSNGSRRTTFGTHFETSCSIISRNLVPSRFSPVPFHGRWCPSTRAQQQQHSAFWLRFGRLPPSPTYSLRSIPTEFRALTPHYEVDEPESPSASSYGLVFNFSQLSVNEISGEEMDIEVDSSLSGSSQPADFITASLSAEHRVSQVEDVGGAPGRLREPLPDIVASHRSSSFSTRTSGKHVHRNTLHSFQEVAEAVSLQERRTMSVSLPIEEQVISHVASQLRQISNDFSSSRQLQRFNPLSSLSPVLDLLATTLYGSPQRSRPITRRQTFNGGTITTSRVVNNSRFYTEPPVRAQPPPTPTTTGNSTFYVGTTTTTKAPNRK